MKHKEKTDKRALMEFSLSQAFLMFCLLLAIPLVLFLLWADSFEKELTTLQAENPVYPRQPEVDRVRFVSFLTLSTELFFFLSADTLREAFSPFPQLLWMASVLAQFFFQLQTEGKVRPAEGTEFDFLPALIRGLFCWVLGMSLHLMGVAVALYGVIQWNAFSPLSPFLQVFSLLSGAGLGLGCALLANRHLASFYLQRIFKPLDLKGHPFLSPLSFLSSSASCWGLPLPQFTFYQVWLAPGKKEAFFFSLAALERLSAAQLQAVIQYRQHLRVHFPTWKKILQGATLFFLSLLGVSGGTLLLPSQWHPEIALWGFVGSTWLAFFMSRGGGSTQLKEQQQADLSFVALAPVSADLWMQTLVCLDSLQLEMSLEPYLISPQVMKRLEVLEAYKAAHQTLPLAA